MTLALETLQRLGVNCEFCVDVGAYHGQWTKLFKKVFPSSKVLMVEAQPAKFERLKSIAAGLRDVDVTIALLGPTSGELLTFYEMETGSSVLSELSTFPRKAVERTAISLDELLRNQGFPRVDFIKLDVQGFELHVLKGAANAVVQANAILLEASLLRANTGCPLFFDVIETLDAKGFRLFDICGYLRRKDGVLWQTDLLFLRNDSPHWPSAELNESNW